MKKILFSLMAIALVAGLIGAGAFAQFNDSETSEGNLMTAGTLDLQINDSFVLVGPHGPAGGDWWDDPDVPLIFESMYLIDVSNLKPGDGGFIPVYIRNDGTIDGRADIHFIVVASNENGFEEPEVPDGGGPGGLGELCQSICVSLSYGPTPVPGYTFADAKTLADLDCVDIDLGPLGAGEEAYIAIVMWIPASVGNEIMGDTCVVDVEFTLDQA